MSDSITKGRTFLARVIGKRSLGRGAYVLRFERHGLRFLPGQHILVGPEDARDMREYSVYSTPHEEELEILFREVAHGSVSKRLAALSAGDAVRVEGPYGEFVVDESEIGSGRFLFVATGTGIAPFHCFTGTYPLLEYRLLHGVRSLEECFDHESYDPGRHVSCTTAEPGGRIPGQGHRLAPRASGRARDPVLSLREFRYDIRGPRDPHRTGRPPGPDFRRSIFLTY